MITPQDISRKAENKIPEVLAAWLTGRDIFPLILRSDKSLTAQTFEALTNELSVLLLASKDKKGYGYRVQLKEVNTRKLGRQKMPESIVFDTAEDFWKYIGKEKQWIAFQADVQLINTQLPQLKDWINANPLKVLGHAGKWPGLLQVCQWFIERPQPNCYLREVSGQPDTKFIERNMGIVETLLTELIGEFIFRAGATFEERFHLKTYDRLVHIRLLDTQLTQYFSGISHIGLSIPDLALLHLPCHRIIIMENEASYSNIENFLALPQLKDTLVIFGSGYAVSDLKQVTWLQEKEIYYWGDIDEHGFHILHQLRSHFPQTQSILMDEETYLAFQPFAGSTPPTPITLLPLLNEAERKVFSILKANPSKNRLEQEWISQEYVLRQLELL